MKPDSMAIPAADRQAFAILAREHHRGLLIYDYDNSAKLSKGGDRPYVETRFGMIVDGKGTKGRYVRLYSNGNTSNEMNHYIEVEVFGIFG